MTEDRLKVPFTLVTEVGRTGHWNAEGPGHLMIKFIFKQPGLPDQTRQEVLPEHCLADLTTALFRGAEHELRERIAGLVTDAIEPDSGVQSDEPE